MVYGICPNERPPHGFENAKHIPVKGCDYARAENPDNIDGDCMHWIDAPWGPEGLDNPNKAPELLHGEGENGAVNCYPGLPGQCHNVCYIFVDWVSNPWRCLENQIKKCPDTEFIYIVGHWDSLSHHQMRGRKIRHWLNGAGLLRPKLVNVQAREALVYGGGRLEHLYP